jgi:hypothetical protein
MFFFRDHVVNERRRYVSTTSGPEKVEGVGIKLFLALITKEMEGVSLLLCGEEEVK